METTLTVAGMHCDNCAARVEKALQELDGVNADVSFSDGTARVTHPDTVSVADLQDAVKSAGYAAEPA
ncbi:MAG: heavy-metal-associated domain-containing protein [Thiohalorhabdaceae bacterium]